MDTSTHYVVHQIVTVGDTVKASANESALGISGNGMTSERNPFAAVIAAGVFRHGTDHSLANAPRLQC